MHKFNKWVIETIYKLRLHFQDIFTEAKGKKGQWEIQHKITLFSFIKATGVTIALLILIIYKYLFITKHQG